MHVKKKNKNMQKYAIKKLKFEFLISQNKYIYRIRFLVSISRTNMQMHKVPSPGDKYFRFNEKYAYLKRARYTIRISKRILIY